MSKPSTNADLNPNSLGLLDRAAFQLAFFEECERADPKEAVVEVARRAMRRVRAWQAAHAGAGGL